VEETSMSDQDMTRRNAVKLAGTTLAAVGLSAGASAAAGPADPVPARGTGYPDFRGKTVVFYTRRKGRSYILSDPVFEMQAGRLFVTGKGPMAGSWADGLTGAVPWESVDGYFVFDSAEDYVARGKENSTQPGARSEADTPADRPRD
jgi:hypothetical protein